MKNVYKPMLKMESFLVFLLAVDLIGNGNDSNNFTVI